MSDDVKTPSNNKKRQASVMNRLGAEIGVLVARSMSGKASAQERDEITYLSRQRAKLLGQPPKRLAKVD